MPDRPAMTGLTDEQLSIMRARACVLHFQGGVSMPSAMETAIREVLARYIDLATMGDYKSHLAAYMADVRRRRNTLKQPRHVETVPVMVSRLADWIQTSLRVRREEQGAPQTSEEKETRFNEAVDRALHSQPWHSGTKAQVRQAVVDELQKRARAAHRAATQAAKLPQLPF